LGDLVHGSGQQVCKSFEKETGKRKRGHQTWRVFRGITIGNKDEGGEKSIQGQSRIQPVSSDQTNSNWEGVKKKKSTISTGGVRWWGQKPEDI